MSTKIPVFQDGFNRADEPLTSGDWQAVPDVSNALELYIVGSEVTRGPNSSVLSRQCLAATAVSIDGENIYVQWRQSALGAGDVDGKTGDDSQAFIGGAEPHSGYRLHTSANLMALFKRPAASGGSTDGPEDATFVPALNDVYRLELRGVGTGTVSASVWVNDVENVAMRWVDNDPPPYGPWLTMSSYCRAVSTMAMDDFEAGRLEDDPVINNIGDSDSIDAGEVFNAEGANLTLVDADNCTISLAGARPYTLTPTGDREPAYVQFAAIDLHLTQLPYGTLRLTMPHSFDGGGTITRDFVIDPPDGATYVVGAGVDAVNGLAQAGGLDGDQWEITTFNNLGYELALIDDTNMAVRPALPNATVGTQWRFTNADNLWDSGSVTFNQTAAVPATWVGSFLPPPGIVGVDYTYDTTTLSSGDEPRTYAIETGTLPSTMTYIDGVFGGYSEDGGDVILTLNVSNAANPGGDISVPVTITFANVLLSNPRHQDVTDSTANIGVTTNSPRTSIGWTCDPDEAEPSPTNVALGLTASGMPAADAGSFLLADSGTQPLQAVAGLPNSTPNYYWFTHWTGVAASDEFFKLFEIDVTPFEHLRPSAATGVADGNAIFEVVNDEPVFIGNRRLKNRIAERPLSEWASTGGATVTVNSTGGPDGAGSLLCTYSAANTDRVELIGDVFDSFMPSVVRLAARTVGGGNTDIRIRLGNLSSSTITVTGAWQQFSVPNPSPGNPSLYIFNQVEGNSLDVEVAQVQPEGGLVSGEYTPLLGEYRSTDYNLSTDAGFVITESEGAALTDIKGVQVEGARANLFTASMTDMGEWTPSNLTIDPVMLMDQPAIEVVENAASGSHHLRPVAAFSAASSTSSTVHCYMEVGATPYIILAIIQGANSYYVCFDVGTSLITETGAEGDGIVDSASVSQVGSGLVKVSLLGRVSSSTTRAFRVAGSETGTPGSTVPSYLGQSRKICTFVGVQFEEALSGSSLAITAGAPATRSDVVLRQSFDNLVPPIPTKTNDLCGQIVIKSTGREDGARIFALNATQAVGTTDLFELYWDANGDIVAALMKNMGGASVIATVSEGPDDTLSIKWKLSVADGLTVWVNNRRSNYPSTGSFGVALTYMMIGRKYWDDPQFPAFQNVHSIRIVGDALSDMDIEAWGNDARAAGPSLLSTISPVVGGSFSTDVVAPTAPYWETTPNLPGGTVGTPYSYDTATHVNIDATEPLTFSTASTLPAGMVYQANGELSGTPAEEFNNNVTLTVSGPGGSASVTVQLAVSLAAQAPVQTVTYQNMVLIEGDAVSIDLGDPYWSSNSGANAYTQQGVLPAGLSFADPLLTGTPTVLGVSSGITITATNLEGPAVGNTFNITIVEQSFGGSRGTAKYNALQAQGFTGHINGMTLGWLQANGATSDNLPDAWKEMLTTQLGITMADAEHRSDMWFDVLGILGYTGDITDRELAFWQAQGSFDVGANVTTLRKLLDASGNPLMAPGGHILQHNLESEDDMLFTDYWPCVNRSFPGPYPVATLSDDDDPTINTTWQLLETGTFEDLPPGEYEILANWEWEDPAKKKGVQFQLIVDSQTEVFADNSDVVIDYKTMTKAMELTWPTTGDVVVTFSAAAMQIGASVSAEDLYFSLKKMRDYVPPL